MILLDVPQLEPPAIVTPVKRRKRRSRSNGRASSASVYTAGAIIILTGSDGEPYRCQLTHQDQNGQWWCNPVN